MNRRAKIISLILTKSNIHNGTGKTIAYGNFNAVAKIENAAKF